MADAAELSDAQSRFFMKLVEQTAGDPQKQVSMYQIGEATGLNKSEASRISEDLMAFGLVEIRTLAGAIGLTAAAGLPSAAAPESTGVALGDTRLLRAEARAATEELLAQIKAAVAGLKLDFDDMTEMTADIRTIEAQLTSSRPKTTILRETLTSLRRLLQDRNADHPLCRQLQNILR